MSTTAKLPDLYLGDMFSMAIEFQPGSTSATPCSLSFENAERQERVRMVYYGVGNPANDAEVVTIDGVQCWEFKKPAEWTRVETNLPPGDYFVFGRIGPGTGYTKVFEIGLLSVKLSGSGEPLL